VRGKAYLIGATDPESNLEDWILELRGEVLYLFVNWVVFGRVLSGFCFRWGGRGKLRRATGAVERMKWTARRDGIQREWIDRQLIQT
jgi:hypothetical protein